MSPLRRPATLALLAAACLASAGRSPAQSMGYLVPDAETRNPPTQARLEAIEAEAAASGWNAIVAPIRRAAIRAYEQDRFDAASAWFHVYKWAAVFSEPENRFIAGWIAAVEAGKVNYAGVAGEYHPTDKPIGLFMSPELQAWVLSNRAFSREFFSLIKPVDHLPTVLAILEGLHRRGMDKFEKYSSLALAIAVVYDVAPPPYWPHAQVTLESLPRRLPNPSEPYERLIREDMAGRTYFRISQLPADELKFVVDSAAPASELAWAETYVPYTLEQFARTYDMVGYRMDRMSSGRMVWGGIPYTLQAVRSQGGICVDQAYFATEAGKARGVPTLLFTGRGHDGRHAWFGYLDGQHQWQLDAGRYADQRLVTGSAYDPQTWMEISDQELQFLAERFRALPSFLQSQVHEEFARDFLEQGDPAASARAARTAVNYERRNVDAWEVLIAAGERMGLEPAKREAVLREAALAFTPRYPDLVYYYENRVCESLRARGETSLAHFEEEGLANRMNSDRYDLSIRKAQEILSRSIATQQVPDQIATYNALLVQFGQGAGTLFFDRIVIGFAEHLALQGMRPQAREVVERARQVLEVQPGTQVAMDMDRLMGRLQD